MIFLWAKLGVERVVRESGMKIYAMIPARFGSQRLKHKNLALIDGKPMISYSVEAAIEADVFDRIIVNSENSIFAEISKRHGVDFYQRPAALGSSETRSDEVVADFIQAFPEADLVVWVNPIAPLQTGVEIRGVVNFFVSKNLDSLITVEQKQVHCTFAGAPLNFVADELFARTQDLEPIFAFAYSVMAWRASAFMENYRILGSGILGGNFDVYPVSRLSSMIVKTKGDLALVAAIVPALRDGSHEVLYDPLVG